VREEPRFLIFDELGSLLVQVSDGFEGELTGNTIGFVIGWGLQV
jgi:hypothetical protein